jgi:hypothetical protein
MMNIYSNSSPPRIPSPISGVPDSQARALDRRLRLHQQLQSFRMPRGADSSGLPEPGGPGTLLNDSAGRDPA